MNYETCLNHDVSLLKGQIIYASRSRIKTVTAILQISEKVDFLFPLSPDCKAPCMCPNPRPKEIEKMPRKFLGQIAGLNFYFQAFDTNLHLKPIAYKTKMKNYKYRVRCSGTQDSAYDRCFRVKCFPSIILCPFVILTKSIECIHHFSEIFNSIGVNLGGGGSLASAPPDENRGGPSPPPGQ